MPEAAEYQKLARDLKPLVGDSVLEVLPIWSGCEKFARNVSWRDLVRGLVGEEIKSVEAVGKNLWFVFRDGHYLRVHLSSTGWFTLEGLPRNPIVGNFLHKVSADNIRCKFVTRLGLELNYHDPRTWGKFYWYGPEGSFLIRKGLGPEWLNDPDAASRALVSLRTRRRVKDVLCDQSLAAGAGNYVACEALWRAGVHPHSTMDRLSIDVRRKVAESVVAVLRDALASEDHSYWGVFKKKGEKCGNCGELVAYVKDRGGSRGSYFCPKCQNLTNS